MTLLWVLLALLALVLVDVPIAVALGVASVVAMAMDTGLRDLPNVPLTLFDGAVKFSLIAVPLFILAGAIMNASGISRRLIGPDFLPDRVRARRAGNGDDRHVAVLRGDFRIRRC